jgi:hypothetical protein
MPPNFSRQRAPHRAWALAMTPEQAVGNAAYYLLKGLFSIKERDARNMDGYRSSNLASSNLGAGFCRSRGDGASMSGRATRRCRRSSSAEDESDNGNTLLVGKGAHCLLNQVHRPAFGSHVLHLAPRANLPTSNATLPCTRHFLPLHHLQADKEFQDATSAPSKRPRMGL